MYIHAQDWEAALRVAEGHEPESVGDVLAAQVGAGPLLRRTGMAGARWMQRGERWLWWSAVVANERG
jgi:hypothetical protein